MKGGINQMNQKELLEREMSIYHFYRGVIISFLALAFVFTFYSVFFSLINLYYTALIFSALTLMNFILVVYSMYNSGKLNLKWKAEYRLKEKSK